MNSEHWTDRLSEYLDGELDALDRREADLHLTSCEDCAQALEDLRDIVGRARNLPDRPPTTDLWPGIAAGIQEADSGVIDLARRMAKPGASVRGSIRFTIPQLAAAGIALTLFSSALSWSLATERAGPNNPASVAGSAVMLAGSTDALFYAPEYADELRRLEALMAEHRSELQPGTIRILEKNLGIIDDAIAESMLALERDPANGFLRSHVDRGFRRKVELLRETSLIAGWAL